MFIITQTYYINGMVSVCMSYVYSAVNNVKTTKPIIVLEFCTETFSEAYSRFDILLYFKMAPYSAVTTQSAECFYIFNPLYSIRKTVH